MYYLTPNNITICQLWLHFLLFKWLDVARASRKIFFQKFIELGACNKVNDKQVTGREDNETQCL